MVDGFLDLFFNDFHDKDADPMIEISDIKWKNLNTSLESKKSASPRKTYACVSTPSTATEIVNIFGTEIQDYREQRLQLPQENFYFCFLTDKYQLYEWDSQAKMAEKRGLSQKPFLHGRVVEKQLLN